MNRAFLSISLPVLAAAAALYGCATGDQGIHRRDPGADASIPFYDSAIPLPDGGPAAECIDGITAPCTTSCGSTGAQTCAGGRLGACVPPAEECDGADQDCDSAVDEDQPDRTCTSACGGGVSTCAGGSWSACMGGTPREETCDGTDEDCDGAIDDGLMRPCSNACGSGVEICVRGMWRNCSAPMPRPETCDGTDEDCDGVPDDLLTRGCSSACGAGVETCTMGTWAGCTAPLPATETCNMRDDDCDGVVDDGFQARIFDPVTFAELSAEQGPCNGPAARMDYCATAARRWCLHHMMGCFSGGGVGVLQALPTTARIVCLGTATTERTVTFADVNVVSSSPITESTVTTRLASSATHRYCRSIGFETGVGPTEHGPGTMTITCLPDELALTEDVPTADLIARGCDPVRDPNTLGCSSAADLWCRDNGYTAGYGPVEWNDTSSAVACIR